MPSFAEIVQSARMSLEIAPDRPARSHDKVLDLVRRLKQEGSDALQDYVHRMEQADKLYRAFYTPDETDKKASARGEPMKIIYPVTYAQIQTTLAALMGIFNTKPFFELEGRSPEYQKGALLMELELQYELERIGWGIVLYQFLLDILRYGFGKIDVGYEQERVWIRQTNQLVRAIPLLGLIFPTEQDVQTVAYEGASLSIDDPYNIRFDPQVSIGRFQQGQFVFRTEQMSYNELKHIAPTKGWYNYQNLPRSGGSPLLGDGRLGRRHRERFKGGTGVTRPGDVLTGGEIVTLDHCYVKLVPRDYGLSELDDLQIWVLTMANDARIIGAEPSRFEHGVFPSVVAEYSPDEHSLVNYGLAQTIEGLQEQINWLLNSRIDNVRKVVNDVLIVDPALVELSDIENRRTVVRLKKGAQMQGVERAIKQLAIQDVTVNHITDAANLHRILQQATGIDDTSMGVTTPTERTATEIQSKQRNAAGRIRLLAQTIFIQALRPMGEQMIQNIQQWMSQPRWIRVVGPRAEELGVDPNGFVQIDPSDLQGMYDISLIDGSGPTDRIAKASYLKELLVYFLGNPMAASALGVNLNAIVTQMMIMYGFTNVSDFVRTTGEVPVVPPPTGGNPSIQVLPDEEVAREVQRGNLIPSGGGNGPNRPTVAGHTPFPIA